MDLTREVKWRWVLMGLCRREDICHAVLRALSASCCADERRGAGVQPERRRNSRQRGGGGRGKEWPGPGEVLSEEGDHVGVEGVQGAWSVECSYAEGSQLCCQHLGLSLVSEGNKSRIVKIASTRVNTKGRRQGGRRFEVYQVGAEASH